MGSITAALIINANKNFKISELWRKIIQKIEQLRDSIKNLYSDMTAKYGDINSFEFKTFQEYS